MLKHEIQDNGSFWRVVELGRNILEDSKVLGLFYFLSSEWGH